MTRPLAIIGHVSLDAIRTPAAEAGDVPGGAALYAALGARHAGAAVTLFARTGADWPAAATAALAASGIDTTGLVAGPGLTRRSVQRHDRAGNRRSAHHDDEVWWERTRALRPPLPDASSRWAAWVVMPVLPETLATAIEAAAPAGIPVIADTSEAFAARAREALLAAVPGLAAFCPSVAETRLLLPGRGDDDAADVLAALGTVVLQKRGADGVLLVDRAGHRRIAVEPVDAVDPTGAGDATVGAFAAHLAAGLPHAEAARRAMATGAAAVGGIGPAGLLAAISSLSR
ncbi:carbohydrate kinase family protein [Elioraea sp.]|uniref:carbohydrate kinase family protein n=1 Tax=Elioraea sp. TaxID=2185103 RepID=UPI0025C23D7B|nr:PfkB family carbohydrate kinase [Elioraea sp.]